MNGFDGETLASKRALRADFRARRARLDVSDLASRAHGFAQTGMDLVASLELPAGAAVTGFLPFGQEPPVLDLLTLLHGGGQRVFVPVCLPDRVLGWTPWEPGAALEPGLWPELLEPVGQRVSLAEVSPALMLVPALGVDASGTRLGQGAGYYDRALAAYLGALDGEAQRPVLAGVVHSEEVSDAPLPRDRWDVPVEYALTQEFFTPLGT